MNDDVKKPQENILPKSVNAVYYHSFMSGLANRTEHGLLLLHLQNFRCTLYHENRPDDACGKVMFESYS